MPSFQDPEIQQISHSYFCNSVSDTNNRDIERPAKRARLAVITGDQIMNDVRSSIVSSIYSLMGLEINTMFTGLSQNAAYVNTIHISIWS